MSQCDSICQISHNCKLGNFPSGAVIQAPFRPSAWMIYLCRFRMCFFESKERFALRCGVSIFHGTHQSTLQMLEYKWQPWESFNCWLHVNFIRFWQFICKRCRSPNKSSEPCHSGTINIAQKFDRGQLLHPLERAFFIIQHKRAAPF